MNEDKKYYININEQNVGPLTLIEVLDRLNNGLLNTDDYIFITNNENWIKIKDAPELISQIMNKTDHNEVGWFYRKDKQNIGPVSKTQVLEFLSSGHLDINDYVWKKNLVNWIQIKDVVELIEAEKVIETKQRLEPERQEIIEDVTEPEIVIEQEITRSLEPIQANQPEENQMDDQFDLEEDYIDLQENKQKKQRKLLPEFIFGIILMIMGGYQINNSLLLGGLVAFIGFMLSIFYLVANRKKGAKNAGVK